MLSMLFLTSSKATHIVGGVMNYKYLGNDRYEITLYVYRDCIYGIPPLDNPAILRIWDGVSESYRFPNIPFDSILDPGLPDDCARIETPVCVNWTRYLDTLVLPPNDFGYTIYYQRCCRNNTIQNLTYDSRGNGAMDWGATYTINIPPSDANAQHISNTSPYFLNYPPVYICVNKPISYDNSAIDADGDSLVYSLCTPYSGAFPSDPLNYNIEETPPFEQVVWQSPYSVNDMLGGVPLSINPVTGLLTGTPNTTGQFVVGVCVDEYRNGQLLTQTSRDFQFNIIDCNLQVVSSFFAPTIQCNDFTVNFQNQSSGATDYKWYFGDGDSSTAVNPSHTYADTGRYTVTLISLNSITNTCLARYTQIVSVQYKKIEADFISEVSSCLSANDPIKFIDRSTDSFNVASWKWRFSNGDSSVLQNPMVYYNGTDTAITATLTVTSVNGCTSTISKTIRLFAKTPYTINRILTKCTNTGNAQLSLVIDGNHIFSWTPATGLSNPNIQNPSTTINNNITYYVTIKTPLSNGDTCVQNDSVQVKTINTVQINSTDTLKICNDSVRLNVPLSAGQTVIWSTNPSFIPVIGSTAAISISQSVAAKTYYVKISAQGCEAIDSILVFYNDTIPQISLADNILQCTNQVALNASINYSEQISWSTSANFLPVVSTGASYSTFQIPKTVIYFIKATYKTCSNTDSIKVTVQDTLPLIALDDSLNICGNSNIVLNATVRRFTSLIWSNTPDFSTIIGNSQNIPVTLSNPRQVFYLKAFYRDCYTTDSIVVNYNNKVPSIQLQDSIASCGGNINISATVNNADSIVWSISPTFNPVLSLQSNLILFQTVPLQKYYIKASNGFCKVSDSILSKVQVNLPQLALSDSVFICADSVRIINQINNYDSVKWSYDADFLTVFATTPSISIFQIEEEKKYFIKVYAEECTIEDSITVFYNDTLPNIRLSSSGRFCSDSVSINASVDYYTQVHWFGNRELSSIIDTNLTLQTIQTESEKWYYFKATYKSCSVTDSIKIENYAIRYSKPEIEVCAGDTGTINLNIQTSYPYTIKWLLNNDSLESISNPRINDTFNQSQTVYFSINNFVCTITDSLSVIVHPLPIAEASIDKPLINSGEQIQLSVNQDQSFSYNWSPAAGLSSSVIYNPSANPQVSTLYTVIVTNENQCRNQDTVSVTVIESDCSVSSLYIPNAFSPNGDGVNDVFKVRINGLKNMLLEIYNRWGLKVFETTNINEGWNGTYKDQPAPLDTYGYYFTGECVQGEKISSKGNVTILK